MAHPALEAKLNKNKIKLMIRLFKADTRSSKISSELYVSRELHQSCVDQMALSVTYLNANCNSPAFKEDERSYE